MVLGHIIVNKVEYVAYLEASKLEIWLRDILFELGVIPYVNNLWISTMTIEVLWHKVKNL